MPTRKIETIQRIKSRTEKICSICLKLLPLDSFHKFKGNLDGHYTNCKKCRIQKSHESYLRRSEKIAMSTKEYRKTDKGKLARKVEDINRRKNHPGKYKANYLLTNAVRDGRINRLPCEVCGEIKSEGHHPDYSKPLEVKWLCKIHHNNIHRLTSGRSKNSSHGNNNKK